MNILVICKRHYTGKDLIKDRFGRLFHFPVQWAKSDNQVSVITLDYHTSDNQKQKIGDVDFYSVDFAAHRIIKAYNKIKKIALIKKYDFIFASGDQIAGLIGLKLSKQIDCPLTFDMYDDYDVFGINKIPLMKSILRYVVKNSSYICCTSRPIKNKFSKYNANIDVYPNGVDPDVFYPTPKEEAQKRLHLDENSIYIAYTGTIDKKLDIEILIKAIKNIRAKVPNIILLYAGNNISTEKLKYTWIKNLGLVPQSQVPIILSASDVLVMPYKNHPQVLFSNPCKLTEYLSLNKPIVAPNVSDFSDYFPRAKQSLYACGSVNELTEKLFSQIQQPEIIKVPDYSWKKISNDIISCTVTQL